MLFTACQCFLILSNWLNGKNTGPENWACWWYVQKVVIKLDTCPHSMEGPIKTKEPNHQLVSFICNLCFAFYLGAAIAGLLKPFWPNAATVLYFFWGGGGYCQTACVVYFPSNSFFFTVFLSCDVYQYLSPGSLITMSHFCPYRQLYTELNPTCCLVDCSIHSTGYDCVTIFNTRYLLTPGFPRRPSLNFCTGMRSLMHTQQCHPGYFETAAIYRSNDWHY